MRNLLDKIQQLKKSYIQKMPDKMLLSAEEIQRIHDEGDDDLEDLYTTLPMIYLTDDYIQEYMLIGYAQGEMYLFCDDTMKHLHLDLDTHLYLFPLETLVEFNEMQR